MAWAVLIVSGVLEAVWATALSDSKGFRRPRPLLVFVVALLGSVGGLSYAMRTLPTGTCYAVWVGVGAALTVLVAVLRRTERAGVARLLLLTGLVGCVIGLKVVS